MQRGLQLFLTFFLSSQVIEAYSIKHPTCQINLNYRDHKMVPEFKQQIEKKGYKILKKKTEHVPGILYGKIEIKNDKIEKGMLYKDCIAGISIKKAKENYPSDKDEIITNNQVVRKFPRVTFKGHERCSRAIKDVLIHLPKCESR